MNILNNTKVYLAGNMENCSDDYASGWRSYVAESLKDLGIKCLSPLDTMFINQPLETEEHRKLLMQYRQNEQYDSVSEYMKGVVQKDLRLIDLSDFVIVNLEISKFTCGTIHELVVAIQQKKPVFMAVGDKKKCPLWLLGTLNHNYIYNHIDEILKTIQDIDSGKHTIDLRKWRLLLPKYR
jgi:nucleoside 2-deoxyribosyltransferase